MKIPITSTELNGMPDHAWSLFCRYIKNRSDDYTPVQDTASLCYTYFSEIYDYRDWGDSDHLKDKDPETIEEKDWFHGHTDFLTYCQENRINIEDLSDALETIGATEFAENLTKSIENGQEDCYYNADVWFTDNDEVLLNAIRDYWQSNLEEFYEIIDEDYSMKPPKDGFWVGIIIFAMVCLLMIVAAFTNPEGPPLELLIISGCLLSAAGLILFLYAKRWNISVKKDVITIRTLFLFKKFIRFDEISGVRTFNKGTIVYVQGRRLFFISNTIKMYRMFFTQLSLAENITDGIITGENELYSIKRSNAKKVEGCLWPFFSIILLVWVLQRQMNPAGIYEIILFSAAIPVSFLYTLHCLRWKITGMENSIRVRTAFGAEKEYRFTDITKVIVESKRFVVFTDINKSFKVADGANCSELVEKLQSENIPFYKDGELL